MRVSHAKELFKNGSIENNLLKPRMNIFGLSPVLFAQHVPFSPVCYLSYLTSWMDDVNPMVRFTFLTAASMNISVLLDVVPCRNLQTFHRY
jgi:hypothetical protein